MIDLKRFFKNKEKNEVENFLHWIELTTKNRDEFKKDRDYYFHLLNIITPILGFEKTQNYIEKKELRYGHEDMFKYLCRDFDVEKNTLVQERLFYKCIEIVTSDDLKYFKGKKGDIRNIQKNELLMVLHTVCSAIFNNFKENKPAKLSYKYFTESGFKTSFEKKIGRALDGNKLSHIFKVLEKHKLIHKQLDGKGRNVFYVGKANPLYILSMFPDIEESNDVELPLEKQNRELKAKIKLLEETLARTPNKWSIDHKPIKKTDTFEHDLMNAIKNKYNAPKKPQIEAGDDIIKVWDECIADDVNSTEANWATPSKWEYY